MAIHRQRSLVNERFELQGLNFLSVRRRGSNLPDRLLDVTDNRQTDPRATC